VALYQWSEAASQSKRAQNQQEVAAWERERADGQLKKAQTTQSMFLANEAQKRRAEGDAGTAILLALAALPDPPAGIVRPYLTEAELYLDGAIRALRERTVLKGHESSVVDAAFSPDGKRIVTASGDNTTRLWDAETGQSIGELKAPGGGFVYSAAYSPDG